MEKTKSNISPESRSRGALYGLFIGDALAMPVHWYYDRLALQRDYGYVTDYLTPRKCGVQEKHIGGLAGLIPIIVYYKDDPDKAREAALEHLSLTHLGSKMEMAASIVIELFLDVLGGAPLKEVLTDRKQVSDE